MAQTIPLSRRTRNPASAGLRSALIPGAGQAYAGFPARGAAVLLTTFVLSFLINWAFANLAVGKITIVGRTTSWLWLLLALFWLWNVVDAFRKTRGQAAVDWFAIVLAAFIVYFIAWQVTDVNLARLVTRFSDARIVFNALAHPDLITRDTVSQIGSTAIWIPCSNPPPSSSSGAGYPVSVDRSCATSGDPITIRGSSFMPNTTGSLYWVELGGTNEQQMREEGGSVQVTAGPDGQWVRTVHIPTLANRFGVDFVNPVQVGIEVRFVQEVGPPRPSDNFGDIIGRIVQAPVPDLLVNLGIAKPGAAVPAPLPGKIAETIAIGLMATLLSVVVAVPISFLGARNIMARLPAGAAVYYAARAVFNIMRSIDTLIWGIIVVVWVGLGSFAGTIALAIHSVAALAKLYSEEIEHIDSGPIEAVTASGANLLQVIRYAVIPQIIPPFLAYTLLRWDINMRSATVVGIVAGGGIGFFALEAIRKGAYEQYAAALWVVALVIMAVDYVSERWRERILVGDTRVSAGAPRSFWTSPRRLFYSLLLVAAFIYSAQLAQIDLRKLFEPAPTFVKLVQDFASFDLSPDFLDTVLKMLFVTIFQALLATTFGGIIAVPFSFLAARNLTGKSILSIWIYYAARTVLNFLRSIEALLYVAIFVFWVGIGPFAGMLALAVTTFGLIGKLFSEAIENIDPGPLEAVRSSGANGLQTIRYAILPQIVPPFVSYCSYQWDINIRMSTVIGLAGGQGIGLLFQNYANQLQYHKAGTVIAAIVVVVTFMDLASAKIRERLV